MLPSLVYTTDYPIMAQTTEDRSTPHRTGHKIQGGHETGDAYWLEAALRREAAFEEKLRASCAGPDPAALNIGVPITMLSMRSIIRHRGSVHCGIG
jgi:hypothetical protein